MKSPRQPSDSASYMAKPQLYKIARLANELYRMVPEGEQLDDWIETKLAVLSDDIGEVYDFLKHRQEQENIKEVSRKTPESEYSSEFMDDSIGKDTSLESFHAFFKQKNPKYKK